MAHLRSRASELRLLVVAAIAFWQPGPVALAESFPLATPPSPPPLPIAVPARSAPNATSANVWTVDSAADTNDGVCNAGNCSLRDAMTAAQPGDTIAFSILPGSAQTINLGSALPSIGSDLTITGPGARLLTVRANATGFTILTINAGTVAISGLTIADGSADYGGAITNFGTLTLTDSVIKNNHANFNGGALQNGGILQVTGSTISGNSAGFGAAVYNFVENSLVGMAVLTNTTISGNSATNAGSSVENDWFTGASHTPTTTLVNCTLAGNTGGSKSLFAYTTGLASTISLQNTILAGNSTPSIATFGVNAHASSLGNNLASDNGGGFLTGSGDLTNASAQLSELGDFGGPTPTHLPARNSPAVDGGSNSGAPATDQRGVPRPQGVAVDIGAVELRPLVVTTAADSSDATCGGPCSLRDAITAANADGGTVDDIFFSSLFNTPQVINLDVALPDIAGDLTLNGPGANLLTVRRNTGNFAIFTIDSPAAARISGMTISNGNGSGIYNMGTATVADSTISGNTGYYAGGIYSVGALVVSRSTISGNSAHYGGGVGLDTYNSVATLSNCTLAENTAAASGGGLSSGARFLGATVQVSNCTVANNSASTSGGGIYANNPGVLLSLKNTVIAKNVAPTLRNLDVSFAQSRGHNLADDNASFWFSAPGDLINTNPLLATLSNYGGTTQTLFPKPCSPAIDAGDDSGAPTTDQRGIARPQGPHVDIGAVESDGILIFQDGFNE